MPSFPGYRGPRLGPDARVNTEVELAQRRDNLAAQDQAVLTNTFMYGDLAGRATAADRWIFTLLPLTPKDMRLHTAKIYVQASQAATIVRGQLFTADFNRQVLKPVVNAQLSWDGTSTGIKTHTFSTDVRLVAGKQYFCAVKGATGALRLSGVATSLNPVTPLIVVNAADSLGELPFSALSANASIAVCVWFISKAASALL